ncbi:hypothetical protein GFB49_04280 [Epibacterium sp. SM1979]|uniref:AAA+ family ATPase n=1 Tax=Tritonibacter litoralis TaxID=2662264 RepID=A0A843YDC8_9RHOB|nr:hypothetical protein [Tritonibacter litoralis]MQQ07665.1 hypothetical protein [Tritonibacter litoralis]
MPATWILPQSFCQSLCRSTLLGAALALSLTGPAAAQSSDDGPSLMERGADLFLRGLREEMAPTLEGFSELMGEIGPSMGEFLAQMGPALAEIAAEVQDWSAYELPEILPNGDIIIRKKRETPETPDSGAAPDTDIEI